MLIELLSEAYLTNETRFGRFVRDDQHNIHLHQLYTPESIAAATKPATFGLDHSQIAETQTITDQKDAGSFRWYGKKQPPELIFYDCSSSLQVGVNAEERRITGEDSKEKLSKRTDILISALPYPQKP